MEDRLSTRDHDYKYITQRRLWSEMLKKCRVRRNWTTLADLMTITILRTTRYCFYFIKVISNFVPFFLFPACPCGVAFLHYRLYASKVIKCHRYFVQETSH